MCVVDGALRALHRQWQPVHHVGHDRVGGTAAELGLGGRDDPVREYRHGEVLEIVG
jgi:hypothetical protein